MSSSGQGAASVAVEEEQKQEERSRETTMLEQKQAILDLFAGCSLSPGETWPGVSFDSDTGYVLKIDTRSFRQLLSGSLNMNVWSKMATLLPKLEKLNLSSQHLTTQDGVVLDLTNLPSSLHHLDLSNNNFTNRLDLSRLPRQLKVAHFSRNNFTGTLDLTKLPETLTFLSVGGNMGLTGSLDFRNLPKSLEEFAAYECGFVGVYDLTLYQCGINLNMCPRVVFVGSKCTGTPDVPLPCILCFVPAFIIIIVLALGPVIAANSDSLSHSVCEQHLNGTCASFFDSCSTSTQVTALPPHGMLCPLSTKCCVAGNDNFFLARAAAGDTNNTFFYSSRNDDGGNETTAMMQQSSFNYFLSPPVDYIGSEAVKEGGVDVNKALAQLCGKVGFGPVPPGAMWILLGGVLSAISSVFLNLLASDERYMRLSAAVGARLARCCRCACPALCFRKCCEDDHAAAEDEQQQAALLNSDGGERGGGGSRNYGTHVDVSGDDDDDDDAESLATAQPQESLPAGPSSGSRFFLKSRERRLQEQLQVAQNVGFVRRCFKPSGLLGWKSLFFLLVAFIDAIYTVAVMLDGEEELSSWERFNAFVAILVNGSFLKGGFDVILVSLVAQTYDTFIGIDMKLARGGCASFVSSLMDGACLILIAVPLEVSVVLFQKIEAMRLPPAVRHYQKGFAVILAPILILFIVPGVLLFFPLVLEFLLIVLLSSFILTLLSLVRVRCLKRDWSSYSNHWRKAGFAGATADSIFHFVRMTAVIVLCNMVANYLFAMPSNMMTLVYTQGTAGSPNTYVHGEGYARTLFDELATRSQSCYYLQRYVSGIHGFQTFLRLF